MMDGVGLAPTQINVGAGLICASGSSTVRKRPALLHLATGISGTDVTRSLYNDTPVSCKCGGVYSSESGDIVALPAGGLYGRGKT